MSVLIPQRNGQVVYPLNVHRQVNDCVRGLDYFITCTDGRVKFVQHVSLSTIFKRTTCNIALHPDCIDSNNINHIFRYMFFRFSLNFSLVDLFLKTQQLPYRVFLFKMYVFNAFHFSLKGIFISGHGKKCRSTYLTIYMVYKLLELVRTLVNGDYPIFPIIEFIIYTFLYIRYGIVRCKID